LAGGTSLREWVDAPSAKPGDFEEQLLADERTWQEIRQPYLKY
jgi:hypothetical protein